MPLTPPPWRRRSRSCLALPPARAAGRAAAGRGGGKGGGRRSHSAQLLLELCELVPVPCARTHTPVRAARRVCCSCRSEQRETTRARASERASERGGLQAEPVCLLERESECTAPCRQRLGTHAAAMRSLRRGLPGWSAAPRRLAWRRLSRAAAGRAAGLAPTISGQSRNNLGSSRVISGHLGPSRV